MQVKASFICYPPRLFVILQAEYIPMPLSPEQIAKIRQKEEATPDALKRNPLNDYTEGWFHVTLNVRGEAGHQPRDVHGDERTGTHDSEEARWMVEKDHPLPLLRRGE